MKWQELLMKTPRKQAKVKPGETPVIAMEIPQPAGFGPQGFMAGTPEPVPQAPEVRMKDQVMG